MSITHNACQSPADVAVAIPSTLRPQLMRAARSVFRQEGAGRIHLLIGVDVAQGDASILEALRAECPDHVVLTVLDLGYSTSRRHGGVHSNAYSGALRSLLTLAANSVCVAYLDDDDWYAPTHLRLLAAALEGRRWAFSHRWLVDAVTGWPICPDEWDSVGPGRGVNLARFGGFVQPSTLMIDKLACAHVVPLWASAAFPDGTGEDRLVFQALREAPWGCSQQATCFHTLGEDAVTHDHHLRAFEQRGLRWIRDRAQADRLLERLADARACLAEHRPADGLIACEAALAIHPHHAAALGLKARCLEALERADEAGPLRARAALLESGAQAAPG